MWNACSEIGIASCNLKTNSHRLLFCIKTSQQACVNDDVDEQEWKRGYFSTLLQSGQKSEATNRTEGPLEPDLSLSYL